MQIIKMTQNTLKRHGHDSRDCRAPRLSAVVKVSYVSFSTKAKDNTCISFGS